MSKIDNGGPAYPGTANTNNEYSDTMYPGMTLRDWFAGQALCGIMANPVFSCIGDDARNAIALDQADKMLSARKV